jgi:hypothetical protein
MEGSLRVQKMRHFLTLLLYFGFFISSSPVFADFGSPRLLANPTYILDKTGEEFLLYRTGDHASAAIYAIAMPYAVTIAEFTKLIEQRLGVASQEKYQTSGFKDMFDDMALEIDDPASRDLWKDSWKTATAKLNSAGFTVEGFRQAIIRSKPYNQYPSRSAFSVLNLRFLDATQVVGKPGTILILYRTDKAKEWWQQNPHNPFSFGYRMRAVHYVTRTEHAIFDSWATGVNVPYELQALGANPVTAYEEEWGKVRKWFDEQSRSGK